VRKAAGDRFDQLELAVLTWQVVITDHRRSTAEQVALRWGMTADQVLASPYFLISSLDAIVADVGSYCHRRFGTPRHCLPVAANSDFHAN
jgi:hypothetical protein